MRGEIPGGIMLRQMLAAVLCLSLLCSTTACTTLQAVDPLPKAGELPVEAGDEVHVVLRSGAQYDLKVQSVSDAGLIGADGDGNRWKVRYADIRSLEQRRFSAWKTAGLTLALVGAALVALAALGAHALSHDLDDHFGGD